MKAVGPAPSHSHSGTIFQSTGLEPLCPSSATNPERKPQHSRDSSSAEQFQCRAPRELGMRADRTRKDCGGAPKADSVAVLITDRNKAPVAEVDAQRLCRIRRRASATLDRKSPHTQPALTRGRRVAAPSGAIQQRGLRMTLSPVGSRSICRSQLWKPPGSVTYGPALKASRVRQTHGHPSQPPLPHPEVELHLSRRPR